MENLDFNKIENRLNVVAPEIKRALFSDEFGGKVSVIAANFELTEDKVGLLADAVGKVLLGLAFRGDFTKSLVRALQMPEEQTRMLSAEVDKEILEPLGKHLLTAPNNTMTPPKTSPAAVKPEQNPQTSLTTPVPTSLADQVARYEQRKRQAAEEQNVPPKPSAAPTATDSAPSTTLPTPPAPKSDAYRESPRA